MRALVLEPVLEFEFEFGFEANFEVDLEGEAGFEGEAESEDLLGVGISSDRRAQCPRRDRQTNKNMLRNELEEVEDKFDRVSIRKRARNVSFVGSRRHCTPRIGSDAVVSRSPGTLGSHHKAVSFSLNDRGSVDLRKCLLDDQADEVEGLLECSPGERFGSLRLTPLMIAARAGELSIVETLLDRGASPMDSDARGFDALMYAVRDGHALVAHLLLRAIKYAVSRSGETGYSFFNKHGLTHMLYAATNGRTNCVDILRRNGSRVDLPDATGFTPLMAACQNGHLETAKRLLDYGAKINRRDRVGMTALAWAVREGSAVCTELLLRHGADVELADKRRRPPLFWAVMEGHSAIGERLLQAGATVCDTVRYAVLHSHQVASQARHESRGRAHHPQQLQQQQQQQLHEQQQQQQQQQQLHEQQHQHQQNNDQDFQHQQNNEHELVRGAHQQHPNEQRTGQGIVAGACTGSQAQLDADALHLKQRIQQQDKEMLQGQQQEDQVDQLDASLNSFDTIFEADEDSGNDDTRAEDSESDEFSSDQSPDHMSMSRLELPRTGLPLAPRHAQQPRQQHRQPDDEDDGENDADDDEDHDDGAVFDLDDDDDIMTMTRHIPPSSSMPAALPSVIPTL
ncbi:Ankyrin repeat and KH domain-containing protein 1 [Hondaea fermentalgiana]|uniref:Ankyrin repeat and KH domain-containing protein 1 n=1 Tax=Hondaea fermentalgiana TaxID=2315210 RepID=A0A2R5GAX6_9STRA|nr:Ankyrin repeat and KH domain-containing protein 1 [Hondaea fermentalgiana]|eukprot:GBG27745.1 Ankyrin repeat and KH domain-containing protein 1 [Hondaea fermentalgiana]